MVELAKHFAMHPKQITDWKRQLREQAAAAFGGGAGQVEEPVDWYNAQRPHLNLERFTPNKKYGGDLPRFMPAA